MKTPNQIKLTSSQQQALAELAPRLTGVFDIEEIRLFGSVARGDADEESDLDLLIITKTALSRSIRHQITDIVCEINLRFDTNLSTLVVDRTSWQTGVFSLLPIRDEILREGIILLHSTSIALTSCVTAGERPKGALPLLSEN